MDVTKDNSQSNTSWEVEEIDKAPTTSSNYSPKIRNQKNTTMAERWSSQSQGSSERYSIILSPNDTPSNQRRAHAAFHMTSWTMNLTYTDEESITTTHKYTNDCDSDDSVNLELNHVVDCMNEENNIKLEEQQNDIINHDPQITINDKGKEIPNWLENLVWKTHDLEEEIIPLPNMSWGNRTLNLEWQIGLGIFLGHIQFVMEWN